MNGTMGERDLRGAPQGSARGRYAGAVAARGRPGLGRARPRHGGPGRGRPPADAPRSWAGRSAPWAPKWANWERSEGSAPGPSWAGWRRSARSWRSGSRRRGWGTTTRTSAGMSGWNWSGSGSSWSASRRATSAGAPGLEMHDVGDRMEETGRRMEEMGRRMEALGERRRAGDAGAGARGDLDGQGEAPRRFRLTATGSLEGAPWPARAAAPLASGWLRPPAGTRAAARASCGAWPG